VSDYEQALRTLAQKLVYDVLEDAVVAKQLDAYPTLTDAQHEDVIEIAVEFVSEPTDDQIAWAQGFLADAAGAA
jgi:dihydrodipicolinate synthase/N-acetylneuraminate lyase